MSTEVVMPQMGESIAEGTITKWLKKVGERVERDEPLFEISTDKVDAEIPSPAAGTLTEVRYKEGDTVEVNTVVAVLDGGQAAATAEAPAKAEAPAPPPAAPAPPPPPQQAAPPPPPPPAPAPPPPAPPVQAKPSPPPPPPPPPAAEKSDGSAATVEDLRRTKSSPLVRKIAQEHNVDISQLEGTGLSGRVTKNDILSYIESGSTAAPAKAPAERVTAPAPSPAPAPPQEIAAPPPPRPQVGDRVEAMSVMRKKIAEHMVLSRRTSVHVTTVYEIDMTRIARLRNKHRDAFYERTGTKLTFMPFIFEAVNKGLRKFPIFNAQVSGEQIIYKQDINLGMAVALDWGLIVPVIKRADDLSISGLARAANDLADRARTKQLKPDEVTGGTFTITNPGVFGGLFGTPIINQPQLAILGVGKIEKRAKVMTTPDGDDFIGIRWMAYFALSFDHRVIDGADAERFLAFVKEQLEAGDFSL
ncbi:MAG TPA: 2-oxoglutarate dehydrogenase, E2 component, dihydrolipoamide succinyltransferase [Pyrinomonadaceae bacterium]|nr:2-oxoglutarate dehydrogenase, E2 component, dihydrolipoamide succinyltransferase [Pyrinomonadaceae bacterium]